MSWDDYLGVGIETEFGIIGQDKNGRILEGQKYTTLTAFLQAGGMTNHTFNWYAVHGKTAADDEEDDGEDLRPGFIPPHERMEWLDHGVWPANGMRGYPDLFHLEVCTPLYRTVYEAVCGIWGTYRQANIWRRRAERTVSCASHPDFSPGTRFFIHANNHDGNGHSYGCHENYVTSRSLFDRFMERKDMYVSILLSWLASRTIVIGAGDIARFGSAYSIGQRPQFFYGIWGTDTTIYRDMISTRDQPHADPERFGRLHTITGDTNISPVSNALKAGMMLLVMAMFEEGMLERDSELTVPLLEPVKAFHMISTDLTLAKKLKRLDGTYTTALELQCRFQDCASRFVAMHRLDAPWQYIVALWRRVLDDLSRGRSAWNTASPVYWLDWVRKQHLLQRICEQRNGTLDEAQVRWCALNYHNISPRQNPLMRLKNWNNPFFTICERDVSRVLRHAPKDTHDWFRGMVIRQYHQHLIEVGWDGIRFYDATISLPHPHKPVPDSFLEKLFDACPPVHIFLQQLNEYCQQHENIGCSVRY